MTKVLTTRISKEMALRLDKALISAQMEKAAFLRTLLDKGLKEFEIDDIFLRYKKGEISLGKVCDLLNITKWDALDLLSSRQIPFQYDDQSLKEDLSDFS